jgi:hypothetical protein
MKFHARSFSAAPFGGRFLPAWRVLGVALTVTAGAGSSFGCSVCGCSLSSDWASQGYGAMPGLQADVRYEYYDQSELRTGTHTADRSAFALPNDQEIQQHTLNRNTWLGLDYVFDPSWALSVELPYYDRFHSTIAPGDTEVSTSQASGLGDLRIMGRYQNFNLERSFSLQFGLKLPTGRFDQNFAAGPQAGAPLDRGLQLGSGTTDLLVGGSYFMRPTVRLGCFAQVLADQPLNSRSGFRPAPSLSVNGGLRFLTTGALTPQIQVNLRWDGRETGANADYDNSGDSVAYVSPGVTADVGSHWHGFAFLQLPVYQRVNGLQITSRWLFTVGFRYEL